MGPIPSLGSCHTSAQATLIALFKPAKPPTCGQGVELNRASQSGKYDLAFTSVMVQCDPHQLIVAIYVSPQPCHVYERGQVAASACRLSYSAAIVAAFP